VTAAGRLADTATGAPVHSHVTRVAAAVVQRGDGQVLLAQRPPGKAYEG
jgi:hypothetical protein